MTREDRKPISDLPHVDTAMLADILSFTSVEFVVGSIDEFLAAARDGLDTIEGSIATADRRSIERFAHRLRGSCGVTGAVRLAEFCARLEEAAAEAPPAELSGLLSNARAELGNVSGELRDERQRLLDRSSGGAG